MTDKMKIKEVIVVEGKDDTKRINSRQCRYPLKLEGQRSVMRHSHRSKNYMTNVGSLSFTDPDFSGEKIRKIIQEAVPGSSMPLTKKLLLQITRGVLALNMLIQRRSGRLYVIYIQKSQMRRQ